MDFLKIRHRRNKKSLFEQAFFGNLNLTLCYKCGKKVQGWGTRPRIAIVQGVKHWCRAQRFFCPRCKKVFTRLPAFLLPFKHYIAPEIEGVLRHLYNGNSLIKSPCAADESTLRRWWKEFKQKLLQWGSRLEARIFQVTQQTPSFFHNSHALRRLEEILSKLPPLPTWWAVMIKTLWWLENTHPLCVP
jgi:hypothetical protein